MKPKNVKITLIIISIVALFDFIALILWNDSNNRSDVSLEQIYHLMQDTKAIDICYPFPNEKIKLKNPDNIETLCKEGSFIKRVDDPDEVKEYIDAFTSGKTEENKLITADFRGFCFYFLDKNYQKIVYIEEWDRYTIYYENTKYLLYSNHNFFKTKGKDIIDSINANMVE